MSAIFIVRTTGESVTKMMQTRFLMMLFLLSAVIVSLSGCRYEDAVPCFGYYSKDRKIAIEDPRTQEQWYDPKDGMWYTPVIVHRYGDVESVATNMCVCTDWGSSGNYTLETKDGTVKLEDYSHLNPGDPDAIYTSITFKRNGKEEMIPLELLGEDRH